MRADALTFDHVKPRSLGGVIKSRNVVSSCDPCNLKKADRLDMRPLKMPIEPRPHELNTAKRMFPPNYLHERPRLCANSANARMFCGARE
jgi:5-methylcytosine-specific restriction endonuclease McrA